MTTTPKVFDPTLAAASRGGGLVTAAGTYHSRPTQIADDDALSYLVDITGTMVGSLVVRVTNERALIATAKWVTYPVTVGWTSGAACFGIRIRDVGFRWAELMLTVASGSGTIAAEDA